MTDQEAATRIRELAATTDQEVAHADADELLCSLLTDLGYVETVKAYAAMDKWCG